MADAATVFMLQISAIFECTFLDLAMFWLSKPCESDSSQLPW